MKNRKVLNLRTHVGGILAVTTYDHIQHKAVMELWPVGVYISSFKGVARSTLVPFANIIECQLAPEEAEEKKDEKKDKKAA